MIWIVLATASLGTGLAFVPPAAAATCILDVDHDGVCDSSESSCATSGGTRSDRDRADSDGDFIRDDVEVGGCGACGDPSYDSDGDGVIDACEADSDGDGHSDRDESGCAVVCTDPADSDGDGIPDYRDPDSDDDGLPDPDEQPGDSDGDGVDDVRDPDSDDDGVPDGDDPDPRDPTNPDTGGEDEGDPGSAGDPPPGEETSGGARLAGGGCSSTLPSGASWLLVAFVLVRSRRMLILGAVAVAPSTAAGGGVDANALRVNLLGEGGLAVANTETLPSRAIRLGITGDFASQPLELHDGDGNRTDGVVDGAAAATLGIAVGLSRGFEVSLLVPVALHQHGAMAGSDAAGLRDLGVGAKWATAIGRRGRLAVAPELIVPTGDPDGMTGEGTLGGRLQVLVDARLGVLRVGGAVGLRLRSESTFGPASVGSQVLFGGIADLTVSRRHRLHVIGEISGAAAVGSSESPAEVLGSVQWFVGNWVVVAGGGAGLTSSIGSPAWRALAGVAFTIDTARRRRTRVGHPAAVSALVSPAEIPARPASAVARPIVVRDEVEPLDPDHDGIVGGEDRCPDEAETANGFDDDDGCADAAPRFVFAPDHPLVLREIQFETNRWRILPASYPILDELADSIRRQPRLRLRVEGHTDARGSHAANLALSQQRALAVVNYLVAAGIDASRLEYEGFGPTRPIASNRTSAGQQQNRRVEFRVLSIEPAVSHP